MNFTIQDGVLIRYEGNDSQVVIPEGVTSIGEGAFSGCSALTSITIPEGVTSIAGIAFIGCSGLTNITIPESVSSIGGDAFIYCSSLTSITIPGDVEILPPENRVLDFSGCESLMKVMLPERLKGKASIVGFAGCKGLREISLPEGIVSISSEAFKDCVELRKIALPSTLEGVGERAFAGCKGLREISLPEGIKCISSEAFKECIELRKITLPSTLERVGELAFAGCKNLCDVTLSEGIQVLPDKAFMGREELREITLPSSLKEVGALTFANCSQLRRVVVKGGLKHFAPKAFQECPGLREVYISKDIIPQRQAEDARKIFGAKAKLFTLDGAPVKVQERAMTVAKSAQDQEILGQIAKVANPKHLLRWIEKKGVSTSDVKFVNSEEVSPKEAVLSILYVYTRQLPRLLSYSDDGYKRAIWPFKIVPEADAVAEMLDLESLRKAIAGLFDVGKLSSLAEEDGHVESREKWNAEWDAALNSVAVILPYCRYASEEEIKEIIKIMEKLQKQQCEREREGRKACIAYRSAVLLSDTRAALDFAKKSGNLELYAKMRGTTPEALYKSAARKSSSTANAGLNSSGCMSFDLWPEHFLSEDMPKEGSGMAGMATNSRRGSKVERKSLPRIEARLTDELKLVLYDVDAGKEVHSFPKKGSDPAKREAAEAKYKEAKKNIREAVKRQLAWLVISYNGGAAEPKEDWTQSFLGDPLMMRIAQLLVWEQEAGNAATYFTVWQGQTVREDGQPCALGEGKVRLAHPVEMNEGQVSAWQRYFLDRGLKQPFAQVLWEPVISWKARNFSEFYKDAVLTKEQWNKLKAALKRRGIDVRSDHIERKFHYYSGRYYFYGTTKIHLGSSLDIVHSIDDYKGSVTLGRATIHPEASRREINSVLLELDQATIVSQIERNHASALTDGVLGAFTAAQIASFLEASIEHNATDCTAKLLDYKNRRFPEFAEVEEFTLDW